MKSRNDIEREALCRFIEAAAIAIHAAAAVIHKAETPVGLSAGHLDAQQLGSALGRVNAAVSGLMSSNLPDRDFALKSMGGEQKWWRAHLTAPTEEGKPDAAS